MQRWYGGRNSTTATTDFNRAMASVRLETPDGKGFATRDEARFALTKMIGDEMLQIAGKYFSPESLKRLTVILMQFVQNPSAAAAEHDGLRFAIWPVDRPDSEDIVTNVSDLSPNMTEVLFKGKVDDMFQIEHRTTGTALLRRGFVEYLGNKWYKRTEAGKRARQALEQQARG
jgi:hypothetical protein